MKKEKTLREKINEFFLNNPDNSFRVTDIAREMLKTSEKRSSVQYHLNALKEMNIIAQNEDGEYHLVKTPNYNKEVARRVWEREVVDQGELRVILEDILGKGKNLDLHIKILVHSGLLHVDNGSIFDPSYNITLGPAGFNLLGMCPFCGESLDTQNSEVGYFSTRSSTRTINITHPPLLPSDHITTSQDLALSGEISEVAVLAHSRCSLEHIVENKGLISALYPARLCEACRFPLSPTELLKVCIDSSDLVLNNYINRFLDGKELKAYVSAQHSPYHRIGKCLCSFSNIQSVVRLIQKIAKQSLNEVLYADDAAIDTRARELFAQCCAYEGNIMNQLHSDKVKLLEWYFGVAGVILMDNAYDPGVCTPIKATMPDDAFWIGKGYTVDFEASSFVKVIREDGKQYHPGCYERLKSKHGKQSLKDEQGEKSKGN